MKTRITATSRPYWTGFIKLSMLTIGVKLFNAVTEGDKVRFHQIHQPSGERVRQQLIVPGIGAVERTDIVKGYEYEKGHYVTVDPEDLRCLRLETADAINIVEFVDELDPIWVEKPYYMMPDGGAAEEAYNVLAVALRDSGKIAIGQLVVGGREQIMALRGSDRGVFASQLRYADEVKNAADFYDDSLPTADPSSVDLMQRLIARSAGAEAFSPERYVDRYAVAVRDLIKARLEGTPLPNRPAAAPATNLMDALKASLADEATPAKPATKRAATGQRNMLLPIAGGASANAKPRTVNRKKAS
jgi:DNA end-binding protein Ku